MPMSTTWQYDFPSSVRSLTTPLTTRLLKRCCKRPTLEPVVVRRLPHYLPVQSSRCHLLQRYCRIRDHPGRYWRRSEDWLKQRSGWWHEIGKVWRCTKSGANSPLGVGGWWTRLTDVEALEVLLRCKWDVNLIGWRVLARTEEGEGEGCDLAGFGLHWGWRGVTHDGDEAEKNGKGEAFHGGWWENRLDWEPDRL